MQRDIYGNTLPLVTDSRDGDIFHNLITGKNYVFDNGEWNELPQEPPVPGPEIPIPAITDEGKVLGVDEEGKYTLNTIPNEVPIPAAGDAGKVVTVDEDLSYTLAESGGGIEQIICEYDDQGQLTENSTFGDFDFDTVKSAPYNYQFVFKMVAEILGLASSYDYCEIASVVEVATTTLIQTMATAYGYTITITDEENNNYSGDIIVGEDLLKVDLSSVYGLTGNLYGKDSTTGKLIHLNSSVSGGNN